MSLIEKGFKIVSPNLKIDIIKVTTASKLKILFNRIGVVKIMVSLLETGRTILKIMIYAIDELMLYI